MCCPTYNMGPQTIFCTMLNANAFFCINAWRSNAWCSQMTSFVTLGPLHTSRFADALLAVLRLQLPSNKSTPGFCVTHTLTATSKVALEMALQLCVGVGMVVVFAIGAAGTAVPIMLSHISTL